LRKYNGTVAASRMDSNEAVGAQSSYRHKCTKVLRVYGAVLNINKGNPFSKEVVVDSWPDFKVVITRQQIE
ncbi:unnamed protein product, partial [Natator depressus]